MPTAADLKKKAIAFNKKFKVGATIKYKDGDGNTAEGKLAAPAVPQETQVSIYLKDVKGKIPLGNIISK